MRHEDLARLPGDRARARPRLLPGLRGRWRCRPRAPAASPSSRCSGSSRASISRPWGTEASRASHLLVEAMRRAFADRARHAGRSRLRGGPRRPPRLERARGDACGDRSIRRGRHAPPPRPSTGLAEGSETTHLSVVDRDLMAVALTTTLEQSLRLVHRGRGRRIPPQQRDGRLQPEARADDSPGTHRHSAEPRAAREAHALEHEPRPSSGRTAGRSWSSGARAGARSSAPCSRSS